MVWSYSKRDVLEHCPRKYYFQYYGSNKFLETKEVLFPQLARLKHIQNRFLLAGSILHQTIRQYLEIVKEGQEWSLEYLTWHATSRFRKFFWAAYRDPQGEFKFEHGTGSAVLLEFFIGAQDSLGLYEQAERQLETALRNFWQAPELLPFRHAGRKVGAFLEHHLSNNSKEARIDGRVDLMVFDQFQNHVQIVDWKMGLAGLENYHSLQLCAYGLWAVDNLEVVPDEILLQKVFLSDCNIFTQPFNDALLAETRVQIQLDLEKISYLDKFGCNGRMNAFSTKPTLAKCCLCPFVSVCNDGRETLKMEAGG